jgi:acetyl-CoA synthetase
MSWRPARREEEEQTRPPLEFVAQASVTDPGVYERLILDNFPGRFKECADLLDWYQGWGTTLTRAAERTASLGGADGLW